MKLSTSYVNYTIAQYIIEPIKDLDEFLVTNTNVIEFDDLTNWKVSSFNRSFNFFRYPTNKVIFLQDKYGDKKTNLFEWMSFNENKNNYILLDDSKKNVAWTNLSFNGSKLARKLLTEHKYLIWWYYLSLNESIWAKKLLQKEIFKHNWYWLKYNNSKWAKSMVKQDIKASQRNYCAWQEEIKWTNINKIKIKN